MVTNWGKDLAKPVPSDPSCSSCATFLPSMYRAGHLSNGSLQRRGSESNLPGFCVLLQRRKWKEFEFLWATAGDRERSRISISVAISVERKPKMVRDTFLFLNLNNLVYQCYTLEWCFLYSISFHKHIDFLSKKTMV